MQTITMYFRANDTVGTLVDQYNTKISALPSIVRGMQVELVLVMLDDDGNALTGMESFAGWEFVLASDWDTTTAPQICVNTGITVVDNSVHIPITDTNTDNLITWLSTAETKSIGAELVGFASGETTPGFVLQFSINVRNRRSAAGCGTVTTLPDNYYNKAQTDALFAAAPEFQFVAAAGDTPTAEETATAHSTQNISADTHFRQRNSSAGGDYSPWIKLTRGTTGLAGKDSHHYIAYASDAAGGGFSLSASDTLRYRAEFTTSAAIANPTLGDFTSAGAAFAKWGINDASELLILDSGGFFTAANVETALQELGSGVSGINSDLESLDSALSGI